MTAVNQKEYLKKYLGIGTAPGEKKKKKKKKENIIGNKLKIIDDDADVLISQEIQDDISAANEDAPQIVAVIDDRPPSLRIDEQTKSNLWAPIGESSNVGTNSQSLKLSSSFKLTKQTKSSISRKHGIYDTKYSTEVKIEQGFNTSPLRNGSDYSPLRRHIKSNKEPRSREDENNTNYRRNDNVGDHSPPLKRNRDDGKIEDKEDSDYSPPRRRNREDASSALKGENSSDSNSHRVKQESCDNSPLRRKKDRDCSPARRKNGENVSPILNKGSDHDNSPPRRRNIKYVSSPLRRKYTEDNSAAQIHESRTVDRSPPRKKGGLSDSSPPRRKRYDEDISPPRMRVKTEEIDNTLPRKNRRADDKQKKSRWGNWSPEASPERTGNSTERMRKTLDGKKAGLQDAKELVKETTLLRHKEDEMFKKLSAEVSGMNAAPVSRKEVKDLEEEARQRDNEKKTKEKYDRWGKGLKQVEDQNERRAEQLHEMSKPLARYADDEDLEKYLKEQERDGDPMLAYIRKKKKKESAVAGTSEKLVYLGEFMPNRFGIRPGYRWDGVDRSNGYETKWFKVQNSKRATQEEAFKWSTEDM